jgi:hypothetical protein
VSPLDTLLAALAGLPALPGALCRDQSEVFDAVTDDQLAQAARLCRTCPALIPCSAWAETLGDNDVNGVVAGRVFQWAAHPSLRRARPLPDDAVAAGDGLASGSVP